MPKYLLGKAILLSFVAFAAAGCVSRQSYDENISVLANRLNQQKIDHAAAVRALEIKVQERGKTVGELTARYMDLKEQNDAAKARLGRLSSDLDALSRDLAELKLVVFTNFKGSEANEMVMKINEMQRRIQEIQKAGSPPPSVPASTPAEPQPPAAQPAGQQNGRL